ncbi:TetR/AcrR family transcriptional regulator [Mycobacterium sp. MFM001]|uniref:TetR/AcrR family transcriptional regulator n=1 Tax=Mycobacterium sp. MFM001 TaxID=2049453 RepID=UPI00135C4DD3|nr:TetR/AcrR family transcriptional regulator [Mycobacterium sp. MFM001]
MALVSQPNTRERLLDAAITLFARQGYAQTSIAQIQQECGLAAGSGALYKHFSSKRELLEAATGRFVDRLANDGKRLDSEPSSNAEQALQRAATLIWDGIDDNARLLRIIFREPMFPELADQLWSAITANAYQRFAAGLRAAAHAGTMRIPDPDAAAAVLVASLAYYPMVRLLIGHTPGNIDQERYRAAWIEHARTFLRHARDKPVSASHG